MENEEFILKISYKDEIWKDVKDFEGIYKISNYGRLISLARTIPTAKGSRMIKVKLISLKAGDNGYALITLTNLNHYKRTVLIHRLVAIHFIENPNNLPYVDHIDRNRLNNKVENLHWVTQKENMQNPNTIDHCRKLNLGRRYKSLEKAVIALDNDNNIIYEYESASMAEKDGFSKSCICLCCNHKRKQHKNLKWVYKDEFCQKSAL